MSIVFVEYKIDAERIPSFRSWINSIRTAYPQAEWYEGAEQPGLIVEIWSGLDEDQYRRMREGRLGLSQGEHPWKQWETLWDWVPGGRDKVHIWRFEKIK